MVITCCWITIYWKFFVVLERFKFLNNAYISVRRTTAQYNDPQSQFYINPIPRTLTEPGLKDIPVNAFTCFAGILYRWQQKITKTWNFNIHLESNKYEGKSVSLPVVRLLVVFYRFLPIQITRHCLVNRKWIFIVNAKQCECAECAGIWPYIHVHVHIW